MILIQKCNCQNLVKVKHELICADCGLVHDDLELVPFQTSSEISIREPQQYGFIFNPYETNSLIPKKLNSLKYYKGKKFYFIGNDLRVKSILFRLSSDFELPNQYKRIIWNKYLKITKKQKVHNKIVLIYSLFHIIQSKFNIGIPLKYLEKYAKSKGNTFTQKLFIRCVLRYKLKFLRRDGEYYINHYIEKFLNSSPVIDLIEMFNLDSFEFRKSIIHNAKCIFKKITANVNKINLACASLYFACKFYASKHNLKRFMSQETLCSICDVHDYSVRDIWTKHMRGIYLRAIDNDFTPK